MLPTTSPGATKSDGHPVLKCLRFFTTHQDDTMKFAAFRSGVVAVALTLLASTASAADAVDLKVGDAVPTFSVKDDSGKDWKSADHVGQKIVVI